MVDRNKKAARAGQPTLMADREPEAGRGDRRNRAFPRRVFAGGEKAVVDYKAGLTSPRYTLLPSLY